MRDKRKTCVHMGLSLCKSQSMVQAFTFQSALCHLTPQVFITLKTLDLGTNGGKPLTQTIANELQ